MRIKGIHLQKFRGFEDLEIEFPENSNMVVFIGENGSGKSSLLEGISMILRDTLYKHHKYERADWSNPLNIHNDEKTGKIEISIKGPRRIYDFSQTLSATRKRFTSEERLILEKNRDLTDEEKIELYQSQADMAYDEEMYDRALVEYLKLAQLKEKIVGEDHEDLAYIYFRIGFSYYYLKKYDESLNFILKTEKIEEKVLTVDDKKLGQTYNVISDLYIRLDNFEIAKKYLEKTISVFEKKTSSITTDLAFQNHNLGVCYYNLQDHEIAIDYFQKALSLYEEIGGIRNKTLLEICYNLKNAYQNLGNSEKADFYEKKGEEYGEDSNITIPTLYLKNDANLLKHLNEYIEVSIPLILHYTTENLGVENYRDALPMAFRIPITTNFNLISDWFIEHENEENRKRLRINPKYRSNELETIRNVITQCLTLLNSSNKSHFADLITESEEIVKDGQVTSWLSIIKNGIRLNVNQLSDGEKRVLVLCIDIARRLINAGKINKEIDYLNGTGIILIDEIEQHLHPKWQRMLLPALNKLFPNLQFIVTTHSPQVLSYIPNGSVFTLEDGRAYPEDAYGRDNEWILQTIMEDVNRPVEIKEKLDRYFDAIREDNIDQANVLRKELEGQIGTDEPEFLKADILIRRKQKAKNETN